MNKTIGKGIVESSVDAFVPFMKKDYDIDIVGVWVRHCEKIWCSSNPSEKHFKTKDAVEHYIMYIPTERRKQGEEPGRSFVYTLAKCLIHRDGKITNVENLMDYRSELNYEAVGKKAVGRKRSLKEVVETVNSTLFYNTYYESGRSDYFPTVSTSSRLKKAFSSKTCVFEGVALYKNDIVGYTPNPDWEAGNDYLVMTDEYGSLEVNEKGEYMFSGFDKANYKANDNNYELNILASFNIMDFKSDPKEKKLSTTIKNSNLVESDEKVIFYMLKHVETGEFIPTIYLSKCKMNLAGEVDIVGNTWDVFELKNQTYDEIFSTLDNFDFGYSYDVYSGCNITVLILKMSHILRIKPKIEHFVDTEEFLDLSWKVLKYDGSGNNVIPLHEYATLDRKACPMSISIDNLLPNHLIKKMGLDPDFFKGNINFYPTKTLCHGPLDTNVDRFDVLDPHISIWNTDKEIWDKSFYVCFEYAHLVETLGEPKDNDIIIQKLIYSVEKTNENFELLSNFEKDLKYNDERANIQQRRDLIRKLLVTLEMDKKVSKITRIGRYSTGERLSLELKVDTDFEFLFNNRLIKSVISPRSKDDYEYYTLQGDFHKK